MTEEVKIATELINEAKAHGIYKEELPDEEKRIEAALKLYSQAQDARAGGTRGDAVNAVIAVGDRLVALTEAAEELRAEQPSMVESMIEFETRQRKSKFPEPALPEGMEDAPSPLPRDITKVDDSLLRRLHWERHCFDIYASWLLTQEEADRDSAGRLAEHALNEALSALEEEARQKGEEPGVQLLNKRAKLDASYKEWEDKRVEHENNCRKLRQLAEGFRKDCERLSREWSMRYGSRETAGEITSPKGFGR